MYIETDNTLKSLIKYGSVEMPFARFDDNPMGYREQLVNWHWHNEVEVAYITKGKVRCFTLSDEHELEEGDAIFINSGVIHRFESVNQGGRMQTIVFAPEFVAFQGTLAYKKYVEPIITSSLENRVFRGNEAENKNVLEQIGKVCGIKDVLDNPLEIQVRCGGIWYGIYAHVREILVPRPLGGNTLSMARLRQMIEYITRNYAENITLENIAEAAKISKSEALRCFKNGMAITPVKFLSEYRILEASRLLKNTESSVTRIALMTGFDNPGYFCKVFKKSRGLTPKDYRRQSISL